MPPPCPVTLLSNEPDISRILFSVMGYFEPADKAVTQHQVSFSLTTTTTPLPPPRRMSLRSPERRPPLPMELVISILHEACYGADSRPDKAVLRNCALVCKDWSYLSQVLLFQDVKLASRSACDNFKDAVTRFPGLGEAVTRLSMVVDSDQPQGLVTSDVGSVVDLCPKLEALDLALYGSCGVGEGPSPPFNDNTLTLLRNGPRISSLHLGNWTITSACDAALSQLLGALPSITSLSLSGHESRFWVPTEHISPLNFIQDLRINFQPELPIAFMKWLLGNSPVLRRLKFERNPSTEFLHYMVDTYGSSLQYLSLPSCASRENVHAIQKCEKLQEFRVEHPWSSSLAVWKRLPEDIRRVSFGMSKDTSLLPVIELVRGRDALEEVEVHLWNGAEENGQLSQLKMACAFRGVDLKISTDIRSFRDQTFRVSFKS